ncbi:Clavaminate synthase-like protein [Hypomontagnella submonticulosa]|nr:Clavaminate synthase-like protein [Hypomontagnella submonticulosa]
MASLSPSKQLFEFCAGAVSAIQNECDSILSSTEQSGKISLLECGPALVDLLSRQASQIDNYYKELQSATPGEAKIPPEKKPLILKRLGDIISIAYSKFYAFLFKDLPICWRQLYTDASILTFCLKLLWTPYIYDATKGSGVVINGRFNDAECELSELVKTLDLALILAGAAGEQRGSIWIHKAFELLQVVWKSTAPLTDAPLSERPAKRKRLAQTPGSIPARDVAEVNGVFSAAEPLTPPVRHPIPRINFMPMEAFQAHMDNPRDSKLGPEPLVIRGLVDDWPALTSNPWSKPSYLLSRTFDGRRLVPIEVGRSYVDEGWGQKIVTFGEFLCQYIDPSLSEVQGERDGDNISASPQNGTIAYLAQHPLFTQLPSLRNDILIPDYCYTAPPPHPSDPSIDQPELDEPLLNAWFGPPGTITPLHNDPYHNILTQVVGRKYVRLYSPLNTERMKARGKENGVEMGNTSLMDVGVVEGWDTISDDEEHQLSEEDLTTFKKVPFLDCILEPGDALYIPIGWWHYVRGLSVSFSVSFWWN